MGRILIILLASTAILMTSPAFAQNRVLSLDGDGDYVEIADSEILNDIGSQVTMEVWIKPTAFPNEWIAVVHKSDERTVDIDKRSYVLQLTNRGFIQLASSPSGTRAMSSDSPDGIITLGTWYHIAGIVDAKNGMMQVFVNGAEVARGDFAGDIHVSTLPLRIGWTYEETVIEHGSFEGQMDEVRIWNIARTQEQIQATMFTSLSGKEPGLIGYWRFDDVGDTATDSSPNQIHGRLIGDARIVEAELPKPGELDILTVISGTVRDEGGTPIRDATVRLMQGNMEIAQYITDSSGQYGVFIPHPNDQGYDLFATSGNLGGWRLGFTLREGERRAIDLVLRENISIAGSLLMLDDVTPHVSAVVQAIRDGKVMDTTLSDEGGRYQFINLKPGRYQVRCYTIDGYVYYGEGKAGEPESQTTGKPESRKGTRHAVSLRVELGKTLKDIDFRFAPFKKGTWRNYTQSDGLAHNWVLNIHRTPDGVMWFGTNGGVSRYDGKRFVNLTPKDGLAHNSVWAIYCDPDGVMWFGTVGGVSRYDGEQFVNFTTEDGLAGDFVIPIWPDPDGVMWFGTRWDGVSRYDGKQFVNFTTEDGLASNQVADIYRDPDGVMWFGTWGGGVSRYDGKEFVNLTTADGLAHNQVADIYRDPDGIMWFGTWGGGVSRYDGREFVNLNTEDGLAGNNVWAIHRDPDGVMWFGTNGGGVSRYDGEGFVNFTTKDGLAHNSVWAIYRGPDGVMWFGTRDGLSYYDEKRAVNFTTKDGLTNNDVWAVHRDPDGVMWFGTQGGISRYDSEDFVNFTTKDGLAYGAVRAIHRDPDGDIWFGTRGGGLSRYDGKEFFNFTTGNGLPNNIINPNAIYRDPDGVLWIGTDGGVSQYDGENFVNLSAEHGLPNNDVMAIHRDPDGIMWFGTYGGGVSRYDGREFISFGLEDGLADEWINTIHRAGDGRLWVGSNLGAFYYDGTGDVNFVVEDELAYSWIIYSIYQDPDGTLWFATSYDGAFCYNGMEWTSLDKGDGLASNNVRSICRDPDGTLWFGTDNGVTRYRPDSTGPVMRILSITTDQTYRDLSHIPTLQINTRVTVEYDSIDFRTTPEKRQYRCKVKEIDKDWRKSTKATSADFVFREPGTYTIEAQAIDRDLNYSEPASIELTVLAPFYMRAVFLVPAIGSGMIILAALIALATALTRRRRQVHAYQQLAVQELQDAREMQMLLLPEAAPSVEGMEIAGRAVPANTVGGDFFDYLALADGKVGIAVADVSGKGLRAAMNATMTNGMMHEVATIEASCGSILSRLNTHLYPLMEKQMFTALSFAIIDQDTGVIQWSNAAQPLPLIKRSEGVSEAAEHGELPLGMAPDVKYPDYEVELQTGDVVIFYTDGIIEAENGAEEMYGTERLLNLVTGMDSAASAEDVMEAILQEVADFVGIAEQYDDMTIVVVKKL